MITYPSADRGARIGSRCLSGAAVGASTLALALAGCGGASKSSSTSSSTPAASSSTTTPPDCSTPSPKPVRTAQPLTKARYERTLGPLFNCQIAPALKAALSNNGAKNPQNLTTAVGLVTEARNALATVNPPAGVASIHRQAVTYFSALVTSMSRLRDAIHSGNANAAKTAATAVKNDAVQIQNTAQQLVAKGY